MALRISTGLRNKIADALANGGAGISFDGGTLSIYSGAQPSSPDDAPTGTLLVSITLPADAFQAAAGGAVSKSGTWQATASAAGTAGWFRLAQAGDSGVSSSTDERIDGSVTAVGGGGDMEVDNPALTAGQTLTVNTFTITMPAS